MPCKYCGMPSRSFSSISCSLCLAHLSVKCLGLSAGLSKSRAGSGVRPNTGAHVSRASGEVVSGGARCHGNDTVLVALQHDLGVSGSGVPELHPSVLGP